MFLVVTEFWRLSVLKPIIPPFCISEKLSGVHVLLLQTIPAFYAFLLVTVSLGLIHLYTKNYRVVRKILKPLNIIHNKAHITAITGESAIVAFATFTFLSSTDIVFAFCGLAKNTEVYSNIDHSVYKTVLFADASIEYLSQTHVIYFLVALIECIFIVFIPSMLLFIYPTRIYRAASRILSTRKQLAITTFVEALNNSFKDGLNGTRDYRAFAGILIFWIPLLVLLIKVDTIMVVCVIFLLVSLCLSYIQPCKSKIANISLCYYMVLFVVLELVVFIWYYDLSTSAETLALAFIFIGFLSQVPFFVWATYNSVCCVARRLRLSGTEK